MCDFSCVGRSGLFDVRNACTDVSESVAGVDPLLSVPVCALPCSPAVSGAPSVLRCEQGWMAVEGHLLYLS